LSIEGVLEKLSATGGGPVGIERISFFNEEFGSELNSRHDFPFREEYTLFLPPFASVKVIFVFSRGKAENPININTPPSLIR
jgi:hypothetical protein